MIAPAVCGSQNRPTGLPMRSSKAAQALRIESAQNRKTRVRPRRFPCPRPRRQIMQPWKPSCPEPPKRKRHWFQFRLRTLLTVCTIALPLRFT